MKLNKIFTKAFVALAAIAGFSACSSDDYEMVGKPTNAQVYFSNENDTELLLEENQNQVEVEVTRVKTDGALTVPVTATDESGFFTVASSVTFADGESTAKLPISFDFSSLEGDTDYPVTLTLQSETCAYGDNTMTVNIKYAPWSEWTLLAENAVYTYVNYYSGADDEQDVYVRNSMLDPTKSQILLTNWGSGIDLILNWDKSLNLISVSPTAFATHSTYGTVYTADAYTYWTQVRGKEASLDTYRSYYDEENGCFYLRMAAFVSVGCFGDDYETLQLPGYEKADYSLTIADNGSYQQDVKIGQVFNMTMGADLTSIKYAVFPGVLSSDEIEAKAQSIFTGDVESTQTKENGWRVVLVDESGDYTLVALGYDADGAWQSTQSVAFSVTSPIGETWRVAGTGDYTYADIVYSETDENLKLYSCDEDASLFAIAPWAAGGVLKFSMDEDGKTLHVLNSLTGEDYAPGYPIIAGDAGDLLGEDASYYDEETNTYYFNIVYFVPGYGMFGSDVETFEVKGDDSNQVTRAMVKTALKKVSNRTISPAPRAKATKNVKALKLMK